MSNLRKKRKRIKPDLEQRDSADYRKRLEITDKVNKGAVLSHEERRFCYRQAEKGMSAWYEKIKKMAKTSHITLSTNSLAEALEKQFFFDNWNRRGSYSVETLKDYLEAEEIIRNNNIQEIAKIREREKARRESDRVPRPRHYNRRAENG